MTSTVQMHFDRIEVDGQYFGILSQQQIGVEEASLLNAIEVRPWPYKSGDDFVIVDFVFSAFLTTREIIKRFPQVVAATHSLAIMKRRHQ